MDIKIPVTFSPHFVKNVPRGYYLLAERLFTKELPILEKIQFVGFNQGLIISVERDRKLDSVTKMNTIIHTLDGEKATWFKTAKLFPMIMGFRAYIPRTILAPSRSSKRISTIGYFCKHEVGFINHEQYIPLYFLRVPLITKDIIVNRKEIPPQEKKNGRIFSFDENL